MTNLAFALICTSREGVESELRLYDTPTGVVLAMGNEQFSFQDHQQLRLLAARLVALTTEKERLES